MTGLCTMVYFSFKMTTISDRLFISPHLPHYLIFLGWVIQGMGPKREKNSVTIFGIEDGKPKRFLLRAKEEQAALDVVKELEKAQ